MAKRDPWYMLGQAIAIAFVILAAVVFLLALLVLAKMFLTAL